MDGWRSTQSVLGVFLMTKLFLASVAAMSVLSASAVTGAAHADEKYRIPHCIGIDCPPEEVQLEEIAAYFFAPWYQYSGEYLVRQWLLMGPPAGKIECQCWRAGSRYILIKYCHGSYTPIPEKALCS